MVFSSGEEEEQRQRKPLTAATPAVGRNAMSTSREESRILHNFTSLPSFNVKWGRRKQFRYANIASTADQDQPSSSSPSPDHGCLDAVDFNISFCEQRFTGIASIREKPMVDSRSEKHQMKTAVMSGEGSGSSNGDVVTAVVAAAAEARPWNLRTRRAVCRDPANFNNGNGNGVITHRKPRFSPVRHWEVKSLSDEVGGDGGCGIVNGPRPKFSDSLSKREMEEDFLAILGTRPVRRPKKRPKNVQKQINVLLPGYWLSEITADMYKVDENAESRKQ